MYRESIYFSPFRLDPINKCLWRDDVKIPLVPKTYDVLWYLVSHPGKLIHKEELLAGVWPNEHVSDSVLKLRISELRKLLGDHPKTPTYIETVHRRGYRFIALAYPWCPRFPIPNLYPPIAPSEASLSEMSIEMESHSPIVGRHQALSQLREWYDQARLGHRQMVFVTGVPGIGKSTFVEMFLTTLADGQAVHVGHGQCSEHQHAREPYLPILEALGRLCRGSQAGSMCSLLQRHAPAWLHHLPAVASLEGASPWRGQVPETMSDHMLRELAETLEQLTVETPLVLVLEDLHWSDPSTLAALTLLARRREPARLLVVGTYRPADVHIQAHPIYKAQEELAIHHHCRELRLDCLTEDDVHHYLKMRFGTILGGLGYGACFSFLPVYRRASAVSRRERLRLGHTRASRPTGRGLALP